MIALGITLMTLALIGLLASIALGSRELRRWVKERRAARRLAEAKEALEKAQTGALEVIAQTANTLAARGTATITYGSTGRTKRSKAIAAASEVLAEVDGA